MPTLKDYSIAAANPNDPASSALLKTSPVSVNAPAPTPTAPPAPISTPTPVVSGSSAQSKVDTMNGYVDTNKAAIQAKIDEAKAKVEALKTQIANQNPDGTPKTATPPANTETPNPNPAPTLPVSNQVTDSMGNIYKQYSDGTIGMFDGQGNYMQKGDLNTYQGIVQEQTVKSKIDALQNNTYTLSPDEQNQVNALSAQYDQAIKDQQLNNAQITGGTKVFQALYGGNTPQFNTSDVIGKTITDGITAITALQTKKAGAISQLTMDLKNNDLTNALKSYDMAIGIDKETKASFQKINDDIAKIKAEALAVKQNQESAIDASIRTMIADAEKAGPLTPDQQKAVNDALAKHDYVGATNALGDSLQQSSDPKMQAYIEYKRNTVANGLTPMSQEDFQAKQDAKEVNLALLFACP